MSTFATRKLVEPLLQCLYWASHNILTMKKSMKHWAALLVMCATIFTFFSCDKDDGDWDPMVWKAEVPVVKSGDSYEVSDRGETIVFSCRNYSKPWLAVVMSGETQVFPERIFQDIEINDRHKVTTDWFTVEIVGNKLIISFGPNKESWEQLLNLTVTAGDIFYTFNFRQLAHQK